MGQIRQARAALALRTACSVLICCIISTILSANTSKEVFSYAEGSLAPILAFLVPAVLRGDTNKISLTFVMSSLVLVPLGMAICGLCYVAGDLRWKPWILALGAGFGSFLAILWGVAAEILHKPRVLLTGSYVALLMFLLPLALAFHEPTTWNWCLDTMCMTGSIVVGNLMSMALSHLPLTGAEPAQRHVPGTAACKAAALAEMFEAVAIWQKPTTAALLRHRQCRLRILTASHEFRRATAAAAFELWQMPTADGEEWEVFSQEAESCRIALQLKSGMLAFGFSPATTKLWYQGALGEALRRSCFTAAYALRCAAGRLAKLSGDQPPPEVPAAPWLTSDYTTALECQEAAEQCRKGLESYLKEWQLVDPQHADPTFRQQLEDVMLEEVKYTDSVNPLEMFLKGDYIMRTEEWNSGRRERVKVAAFDEACRQSALLLGVCQAATAAANMAQNVPEDMRGFKGICCRSGGLSGLRSWLKAPFYCRVWPEAFRKARSFGVRMATAISSIGLVFALAEPNAVWPHRNGPMWTLVTIVLILTPVQGASLQRSLRRFCGTALGSLLAAGSIALVGRPDLRILSSHIFALCFALKFFEPELQYAGTVAFVTYMVVIFSLTDDLDMGPEVAHVELMRRSLHLALRRCLDVAVGVLTTLVVSVFVAPDRAVDELREREEEALRCAAKGMKAACQLLASHASPTVDQETSSNSSQWTELRKEITSSYESLNFAGDGRPGVGDVLEDARWESAWGVDGGVLLLGGLLWFPSCGRRGPPKAKHCLDAVVTVSRLLRSVQTLMGICQSDFGEDAQRPLRHDPRVWATLGPNGEHFTGLLETTLLSAVHTLTGQPAATASVPATVEELTERLEERMNQLFEAAANSRLRAGGLVGHSPQLGGMKAAAALKLLELCVQNFIQICRQLDGGNSEDATMSGYESRTSHSSEKCQDSETEEWTV